MITTIDQARDIAVKIELGIVSRQEFADIVLFMFRDMDNTGKIADRTPPFRQGTGGTASD